MRNMCPKCTKVSAILLLALGVLFLLVDLAVWDFWNIQWWTAAFLLVGVVKLAHTSCPDCRVAARKK
jgi:membrane-bound ClpP family serine protease|tara:strand:+ start:1165 stop:1365 length:201 start_codon:yes stop_codon:yes gene_type:complete